MRNVKLSNAQLRQRGHLAIARCILIGIAGLLALSSLVGCTSTQNVSETKATAPATLSKQTASSVPETKATAPATFSNQASSWKLVWDEGFHGSAGASPDPNLWTPDIGGTGWGSKDLEYNTDNSNTYQDGQGNLVLEARKENPKGLRCWYGLCRYTSARITTINHFSFTYGLIEARIKLPSGQGLWPIFWLLGSNFPTVGWPACGEVDIMENIGKEPAINHGSVHGPKNFSSHYKLPHGAFSDDFHVFALQWDASRLSFFVDGVNYATFDKTSLANHRDWVFDHPFNIVLNLSVGGDWPGSPDATTAFPQKMYVSYIRLYNMK